MNFTKLFAVCAIMLLFGCDSNDSPEALAGTWKVTRYDDSSTGWFETKSQQNSFGKDVVVEIENAVVRKISGTNTTNSFSATFDYVGVRGLKVKDLWTTKIGQPEWGNLFSDAIVRDDITFEVDGDVLRLFYDSTKSITLERQ
jgi:hypothetical protein